MYDEYLLSLNLSSYHKTNVSKTIDFKIYNFNSGSWTSISSSSATSITQRDYLSISPDDFLNSTRHLILCYYGASGITNFELNIDYLYVRLKNIKKLTDINIY